MAAEVDRRKPSSSKRGANRAGNPPAPPARASPPQGCQRTAPPGPRPSGDQPPTLDTSEYPPYPPMSRRPSENKPKAKGTPSGTRTASLAGGNQPRTFMSRQTALSIIPQPREPTRTIVNRAGGRYPNPAPAGINPIYSEIKGSKRETVPAPAGINHENPERTRHDDAFPPPAGTVDALLPRLRESPQKAKAARRRNNPCPAPSRNQTPPDETRKNLFRTQCLSETRIPQARENKLH